MINIFVVFGTMCLFVGGMIALAGWAEYHTEKKLLEKRKRKRQLNVL